MISPVGDKRAVGAALQAVLRERGCALGTDEARALAVALIDLIASGLVAAETSVVHGDGAAAEPSTAGRPLAPLHARGAALSGGGRVALGGAGAVGNASGQTAPAYNMGQSVYTEDSAR